MMSTNLSNGAGQQNGIAPETYSTNLYMNTKEYPKVSGLAAWSENCEWYSSLPLDAVVSLFCDSL
jgi:hypothetical protein